jgi:hypothetical protein
MVHLHNGAGSEAHEAGWWIFKFDSDRESLGDANPIQRRLNVRRVAWHIDAVRRQNAITHALHNALYGSTPADHGVSCDAITCFDKVEVKLADIR